MSIARTPVRSSNATPRRARLHSLGGRAWLALGLVAVLAACTEETPDGGGVDTAGSADGAVEDGAVEDGSGGGDATATDSGGVTTDVVTQDSAEADTNVTDTTVADTAVADTTVADVAVSDGASGDATDDVAPDASADAGATDGSGTDAASTDAGATDATGTDATGTDAGATDATSTDAASTDAKSTDATSTDAAGSDAASADGTDGAGGDVAAPPSCKDQCGKAQDKGCQCDPKCVEEGDCCPDWKPLCGCKVDKDCDDGDACTTDACDPKTGACSAAPVVCDDKNPCTSDSCDATKGCQAAANAAACDDGNACTDGDACADSKCGGVPKGCDDGDPCTADACDPKTGKCASSAGKDGVPCDDGDGCTTKDACKAGKCAGVAKACDDGNPCTKDACAPKTGACEHLLVADGTACTDGSACTTGDACKGGKCTGKGKDCSDDNPCTVDTCDPKTTQCSSAPAKDGAPCSDFNPCTDVDQCKAGKCAGSAKVCDDKNPCTVDACDPLTGACGATPGKDDVPCDDGDACTAKSACTKGVCTGTPVSCDDGQACTKDACDPKTGKCTSTALIEGAKCDDGDKCSVSDACTQGTCSGVAKDCADGKPCTLDACNKATGACTHTTAKDGAACSDGNACTTGDVCKAGACTAGKDACTLKQVWKDDADCTSKSWIFEPDVKEPAVAWHLDATPAEPKPKTGKCTLNFNNGTNFATIGPSTGQVTSVTISIPAASYAELRFWNFWDMEASTNYDRTIVEISGDGFKKSVQSFRLPKPSTDKNKWLERKLNLSAWVGQTVRLRFRVNTVDGVSNTGKGWFVDDVSVWAGATPATCSGSCGALVPGAACQCDAGCAKAGNCCADYKAVCTGCKVNGDCDDNEACTTDACDATTGTCSNAAKADKTPCDDGDVCTVKDACVKGRCEGPARNCDDGNVCTWDFCDTQKGCEHTATVGAVSCDDGKPCTVDDACKAGSCSGGKPKCDDKNGCTFDSCDAKTGACSATNRLDGSFCTDGDPCTTTDRCKAGACKPGPAKCVDGNFCTDDACEAKTGKCTNKPKADGVLCSDGEACTTGDVCTAGKCAGKPSCTFAPIFTYAVDCASEVSWTFAPTTKEPETGWHVDATPATPAPKTGKCSLNFNNGKDYAVSGAKSYGIATLKAGIKLPAEGASRLTFYSFHAVESSNSYDKRIVELSVDGFKSVALGGQLDNTKDKGAWAKVETDVSAFAGKTISVRFVFDSVDSISNGTAGWFVDDITVEVGKLGKVSCTKAADCNDGDACTADTCSGGTCVWGAAKDGVACSEGNPCLSDGACKSGACVGKAIVCDDGNACTNDSCDPKKGCVSGPLADGATCDDGDVCTSKDACSSGTCKGADKCDDGNSCTVDACDAKTGACTQKFSNDGKACIDGNPCTVSDVCTKGTCGGSAKDCDDGNSCTVDSCNQANGACTHTSAKDGTPCEDGNSCTLADLCTSGKCGGKDVCTYAKLIDESFPCDKNDGWVFAPSNKEPAVGWHVDGTPATPAAHSDKCSLNFNNGKDFADGDKAVKGTATSKVVTVPQSGRVRLRFWSWHGVETNNSYDKRSVIVSADGFKNDVVVTVLSNSADKPKAWVQHELPLDVWQGKKIQVRFAFDSVDGIQNATQGWFVDDVLLTVGTGAAALSCKGRCGLFTQGAKCQCNDKCVAAGDCCQDRKVLCTGCTGAKDCDDGNPCTTDTCDAKTGQCKNTASADGTACDDGTGCTVDAKCSSGACVGKSKPCSDGKPCTFDSCKAGVGCVFPPNSAPCDDGNPCTGTDTCSNGGCSGLPKPCNDNTSCTNDSCDPKTGACKFAPKADGAFCSDGQACTSPDRCTKGKCVGTPKDCDDGVACTVDSCDQGNCKHAPAIDGTACNDGDPCTLTSACKSGQCTGEDKCGSKTVLTDAFPCDGKSTWTFVPMSSTTTPTFAVDATPSAPVAKSPKCSLNFNNGKNYVAAKGGRIQGSAVSATVTLPTSAGVELRFWSYHDTESSQGYDKRFVEVSDDGFVANVQQVQLANNQGLKTWTLRTVDLGKWVGKSVKIRFRFDSVDGISNTGAGWFVDDLSVVAKTTASVCKTAKDCGSGPCADPVCTAGKCGTKPSKADGASCDDGSACTAGDVCLKGVCGGTAKVCDDKNPCTWDTCNESTGSCSAVSASDGTPCGGGKVCAAGKCPAN